MIVFLCLLSLTFITMAMLPGVAALWGFVLLAWAWLALMRGLWLAELAFFGVSALDMAEEEAAQNLPHAVESAHARRHQRAEAYKGLGGFTLYTLIWLGLGGTYLLWLWASFLCPDVPAAYEEIAVEIFQITGMDAPTLSGYLDMIQAFSLPCLIGVIYLLSQSYAHSRSQGWVLISGLLVLFVLSAVLVLLEGKGWASASGHNSAWIGTGPGTADSLMRIELLPSGPHSALQLRGFEIGIAGQVALYTLGIFQFLLFISALFRGGRQSLAAGLGLMVVGSLYFFDAYAVYSPSQVLVWISGWAALGTLSVQSRVIGFKRGILRQI